MHVTLSRILLLIALALAGYLAWQGFASSSLAGCGEGSGCDAVLNSAWSKIAGLPVALFAVLGYAAMLGLTFALPKAGSADSGQSIAPKLLGLLAVATLGGIAWFVGLQVFVIRAFCMYCLFDHAVGLLACVMVLWLVFSSSPTTKRPAPAFLLGGGIVLAGLFAGAHALMLPETHVVDDAQVSNTVTEDEGRVIALGSEGQYRFKINELPVLGDPSAENVVMVMVDYQCPKCHAMSEKLAKARELYGDQLAVVYLPAPLNSDCNPQYKHEKQFVGSCELSKLVLAVGHLDHAAFAKFHQWLIDMSPSPELAQRYAEKLVGADKLNELLKSGWVEKQLAINTAAHGGGAVPRLYVGSKQITGDISTPEELFAILEKNDSLKPKGWDILEGE